MLFQLAIIIMLIVLSPKTNLLRVPLAYTHFPKIKTCKFQQHCTVLCREYSQILSIYSCLMFLAFWLLSKTT